MIEGWEGFVARGKNSLDLEIDLPPKSPTLGILEFHHESTPFLDKGLRRHRPAY